MAQSRLLDIAVREFGRNGLEGASTRGIAAAAGTAMSSITYHYGGKDGLYLAAADYIAETMRVEMAPALAAEAVIAEDDAKGARAAIQRIMGRFVDKMASDTSADIALFIMREQCEPSEAFDRIYAGLMGKVLDRLAALICVATGVRDLRAAQIATITLMGQAMTLRATRGAILRLLDLQSLDAETTSDFKARISANVDAILDTMRAEQGSR